MRRTLRPALPALAALAFVAALSLCVAQTSSPTPEPFVPLNTGSFSPPPKTDQGVWDGTWYYLSRDSKVALWIRTTDKIEVRMRYHSTQDTEAFLTDWNLQAKYTVRGRPAEFRFDVTEADANQIRGDWTWNLEGDDPREETAKVTIYRMGDGRRMIMVFDDYLRKVQIGGREMHITPPHGWTFLKASKRLVAWEELPF